MNKVNDIKELMTHTLTQEEGSQEVGCFPSFLILSLEHNNTFVELI